MNTSIRHYMDFCSLLRGGMHLADHSTVTQTAYWAAVFVTMGLTLLVAIVAANADDRYSAGRTIQLYLALGAVSTVFFGIEVPFLILLLSLGLLILIRKN